MYAQDSIDLLAKSGIDFKDHDAKGIALISFAARAHSACCLSGIDVNDFGEILMTSGIVLNENVKWISFHSGYDYGYLLKLLTCQVRARPRFPRGSCAVQWLITCRCAAGSA